MIKKTIKYVDFKGNEREEDFFFNLSKPELMEMELTTKGGMSDYLEKIVKAQSKEELIKWFKIIILKAYGEKSEDGRRFIKSDELSTAFSQTGAYEQLYMELVTDEQKAGDFINAIVPEFSEEELTAAKEAKSQFSVAK